MKRFLALGGLLLFANLSNAEVKLKPVEYTFDGVICKGFVAADDAAKEARPGIVVVHEWWGLNEDAKNRAKMLAELGYVALCADMYGDGALTEHPSKAGEMATAVRKNAETWRGRANMVAALMDDGVAWLFDVLESIVPALQLRHVPNKSA